VALVGCRKSLNHRSAATEEVKRTGGPAAAVCGNLALGEGGSPRYPASRLLIARWHPLPRTLSPQHAGLDPNMDPNLALGVLVTKTGTP
jgi:hypothetical protein